MSKREPDKSTDKSKAAASAPATQPPATPPPTNPAPANTTPTPDAKKRTRSALSTEKTLAIHVATLVAIVKRADIASLLTAEESAQVKAADQLAADLNAQTIGPIKARIKEIQDAFQVLAAKMAEPGADLNALGTQANELSKELQRKQKQLDGLTKPAGKPEDKPADKPEDKKDSKPV